MLTAAPGAPQTFWTGFLATVEGKLSRHVLETWLRPVRCLKLEAGVATLEVRDQFFRDWLTDHYLDFICTGLAECSGQATTVIWQINPDMAPPEPPELPPELQPVPSSPTTSGHQGSAGATRATALAGTAAARARRGKVMGSLEDGPESYRELNPRYRFESFVCGPSNQFASAACRAVAENPGLSYNPLFIFGGWASVRPTYCQRSAIGSCKIAQSCTP